MRAKSSIKEQSLPTMRKRSKMAVSCAEATTGELAAPAGVEDLWRLLAQRLFQYSLKSTTWVLDKLKATTYRVYQFILPWKDQ